MSGDLDMDGRPDLLVLRGGAAALYHGEGNGRFSDVTAHEHVLSIGVASPSVEAPVIVRQLVSAGADIQSVGAEEPPLEDVYIRLLNEGDA